MPAELTPYMCAIIQRLQHRDVATQISLLQLALHVSFDAVVPHLSTLVTYLESQSGEVQLTVRESGAHVRAVLVA